MIVLPLFILFVFSVLCILDEACMLYYMKNKYAFWINVSSFIYTFVVYFTNKLFVNMKNRVYATKKMLGVLLSTLLLG